MLTPQQYRLSFHPFTRARCLSHDFFLLYYFSTKAVIWRFHFCHQIHWDTIFIMHMISDMFGIDNNITRTTRYQSTRFSRRQAFTIARQRFISVSKQRDAAGLITRDTRHEQPKIRFKAEWLAAERIGDISHNAAMILSADWWHYQFSPPSVRFSCCLTLWPQENILSLKPRNDFQIQLSRIQPYSLLDFVAGFDFFISPSLHHFSRFLAILMEQSHRVVSTIFWEFAIFLIDSIDYWYSKLQQKCLKDAFHFS